MRIEDILRGIDDLPEIRPGEALLGLMILREALPDIEVTMDMAINWRREQAQAQFLAERFNLTPTQAYVFLQYARNHRNATLQYIIDQMEDQSQDAELDDNFRSVKRDTAKKLRKLLQ
jgi:hypothetical protein